MVDPHAQSPTRRPRIALAHDWLVGMRGGERVLEAIARALSPDHDITAVYALFDDRRPLSPILDPLPRRTALLGRLPGATRARRWLLPLYPAAVSRLSRAIARDHARQPIDLLISTSSAAIKSVHAPGGVPHLCYCHTPARYLWSQADEYSGGLRGLGLRLFGPALRAWDRRTASRAAVMLANSSHTRREILRCFGRESAVLHPPVRTEYFTPAPDDPASPAAPDLPRPFWLAVGALEPYKRFDLAIDAAAAAGRRLIIVGDGTERARLQRAAGPGATLLGRVGDDRLRDLFRAAELLLFPQVEDFGIVAAEAQACGCPVLARGAGGALDTVLDGATGALFDEPSVRSILAAAPRVPARSPATTAACRASAARFSEAAFDAGIRDAVASLLAPPRPGM